MTLKKDEIIKSAQTLFANEGYNATSTSKVAELAKVSEGLIFRHFKNKEGLLRAIIEDGDERCKAVSEDMMMESNPKEIIRKAIEMPFILMQNEPEFWKLQFKLKWELNLKNPDAPEEGVGKDTTQLSKTLTKAFGDLKYENPEMEAEVIIHFLEGLSTALIKGKLNDKNKLKTFLLAKYDV